MILFLLWHSMENPTTIKISESYERAVINRFVVLGNSVRREKSARISIDILQQSSDVRTMTVPTATLMMSPPGRHNLIELRRDNRM